MKCERVSPMGRVLYLRLGAIGDVVQSAVALAAFKERHPFVKIDWAVDSSLASFVEKVGVADRVIPVNYRGLVKGKVIFRLWVLVKEIGSLIRLGPYSLVINAHKDPRYKFLTFLVRKKTYREKIRAFPIVHRYRVFEYFRLLAGVDSGPVAFDSGFSFVRKRLLEGVSLVDDRSSPKGYVVLAPGGASNLIADALLRRWPIRNYVELANRVTKLGFDVVIVGGETDVDLAGLFSTINVKNMIGKTSLIELFGIMEEAVAVVTHDSGPMHLASISSAPLVALFGPTPANAFIPFNRKKTGIVQRQNSISCSPCYDGVRYAECYNNECMSSLSVDMVWAELNKLIS